MSDLLPVYEPNTKSAFAAYKEKHAESIADTSKYWGELAKSKLDWFTPFTHTQNGSFLNGDVSWFLNGKLNTCYNAVDRWCLPPYNRGEETAIIWEGDEPTDTRTITFNELLRKTSQIANALKSQGVKRGDVVTLYMPMIPETAMTMLACARIGAVHSVIFAGFSADAIAERVHCSGSKWVVTADFGKRGGKTLPLKQICDTAVAKDVCKGVMEKMFVFSHHGDAGEVNMVEGRDVAFDDLIDAQRPYCPCEAMDSEDNLFILYTSGSTGRPKGVLHTTGGYSLFAMHTTATSFDIRPSDVFACVADAGWITGHTYIVYGPLLNGCSTLMFESTPMYPDEGRYWDMVQRHKISIFYTAPTAIRSLMRFGDDAPKKYDLSSLRILGTVGEPINPEAWRWYYEVIGNKNCAVVDTYWQTETGGHIITNLPSITPMKPGSCTLPFFGIDAVVLDPQSGMEIAGNGVEGVLAIKQPWPGMTRTCLGDHDRYLTVYMKPYPGYYFPGDGCKRDEDGFIWITGRVDDVLNVSGHRIGTAEVESALVAHPAVAQAAVVGFPHAIKGEAICCYTTLTVGYDESPDLVKELRNAVRTAIGPFATPDMVCPTPGLPLTRSGKIMRRILRKIASGEIDALGDTSTLADPAVVDVLIEKIANLR